MSDTIDGATLLNEVEAFHRRFNVFPTEAAYVAVALWDAHAHLID
ncbi:DNA primase, partial [Streptomyces anthocyanicus]